jgi:membrane protease YdiL (CAAX protease family)
MDPSVSLTNDALDQMDRSDDPGRTGPVVPPPPTFDQRILAFVQVVLCSDFPTQLLLVWALARIGLHPTSLEGGFDLRYVGPLLLADTVLLIGLILLFLRSGGEQPRRVFLGESPWWTELRAAPAMVGIAYGIALTTMLTVAAFAPWLHNVEDNPMRGLLLAPRDATIFAFLVVLAGGIREELQRAFILTRFEQSLGGPVVGVTVSSLAFGLGHIVQGYDAVIATSLLGAFWGIAYLRRRSVVAPVVSHAAFDLLQIGVFLVSGR